MRTARKAGNVLRHLAAGLTLGLCLAAHGQESQDPSPSKDPALNDPALLDRPGSKAREELSPVRPTSPRPAMKSIPTVPPVEAPVGDATAMPEGTFLSSIPGRLAGLKSGDFIFIPDKEGETSRPAAAMIPNTALSRARGALSAGDRFSASGQVFTYRGRVYLLASVLTPIREVEPAPEPAGAETKQPQPPAPVDAASAKDPRVSDLIKDLESRPPLVARRGTENGRRATELEPVGPITPEGAVIVNRRARLVRLAEESGRLAVSFDADPNSPAPAPMALVPCRALERVEWLWGANADAGTYKISGRVLNYEGRNYFLPLLVQSSTPSNVSPMQ